MGRIWTKVGYRLQIGKLSILAKTIRRFRGKRTPVATFIEDADSVLLKHQKGILNRWREYFCEVLNPAKIQNLDTSEKQIDEEIYLTEAEVSTAIKYIQISPNFFNINLSSVGRHR